MTNTRMRWRKHVLLHMQTAETCPRPRIQKTPRRLARLGKWCKQLLQPINEHHYHLHSQKVVINVTTH
jgi:hypothetical protein